VAERRSHLALVGLILAALAGAVLLMVPQSPIHRSPRLGLDLQGGLEVILKAVPPPGRQLTGEDLDRSVEIMRNRVDKLGVTEPEVTKQGEDQISIQLPGIQNPEEAAQVIGKTAKLDLYDFQANLVPPVSLDQQQFPIATPTLHELLAAVQSMAKEGKPEAYYLFNKTKKVAAGPVRSKALLMRSDPVKENDGKLPKGWKIFAVPQDTRVLHCPAENGCLGARTAAPVYYYLIKHFEDPAKGVPEMTGADLKLDGTRQDFDTSLGQPIVTIQFTGKGEDKFAEITQREAERGRRLTSLYGGGEDVFQHFAIVLDAEVKSTPYIDFRQNPNGIAGGNGAQITGIGSLREAKDLALVLQTGALPVEFRTLEEIKISATLGEDSLREALVALVGGLILVAFFLLVVYRFLGVVAVLGLAVYGVLFYAVILLFDVTLTLPGFAGMVLAIGVAADANIVIFERIKEESAGGKSVRAAIASGYSKGFATIIDANVVTAITALILFVMATGGVRGFAFLLLLGTAISVISAVFATRALLGLLAGFAWFNNPRFMGASAQQIAKWQRFDAVGKRRIWFSVAGVAIALSIGSLIFNGLNLGIDFRGGSQLSFTTPQPVAVSEVREEAARVGQANAFIQGRGDVVGGGFREFQIRTEALEPAELNQLTSALRQQFDATSRGTRNVSASFSSQILRGAVYAMVMSFILITLYITLRFQWRFALPILRTIANDGLIALGIYSFSGREVTASTVAAFLTIIGYSIYDTIIIFDRVRENLPLMRRATIAEIVNQSLWETVRRSLATTFITLLPVGALFFFGGDTLKDFAFAILIGISISAFSTIFIAAPFLAVLLERQPEYRRRKAGLEPEEEGPDEGGTPARPRRPVPTGPQPALAPAGPALSGDAAARRERRRQRRRTRPHGRAR
jgi:SecD/SecF fusion protein